MIKLMRSRNYQSYTSEEYINIYNIYQDDKNQQIIGFNTFSWSEFHINHYYIFIDFLS